MSQSMNTQYFQSLMSHYIKLDKQEQDFIPYEKPDAYFPLRGNGWYYEPMINFCLKNNIVQPNNIKYVIKSSLTIKFNHYSEFINYLYTKFEDDLKTLAVNSMIGSFKPKPRKNWKSLCITRSANEA